MPRTIEERLARAEDMLVKLVDRYNGQNTKGHQEALNSAVSEISAER